MSSPLSSSSSLIVKPEPLKARGHSPGGSYVPKSNIDFSSLKSPASLGEFIVSKGISAKVSTSSSSSSSSSVSSYSLLKMSSTKTMFEGSIESSKFGLSSDSGSSSSKSVMAKL